MRILVTGGAGFIASHVVDAYVDSGHEVVIVDDLSRGAKKNCNSRARVWVADIRDRTAIDQIFMEEKPEIVNHHAAQMDVRRGVREPLFDAEVNILGSVNLLDAAVKYGTKRFIYAATAGAGYGEPKQIPVAEDCPINPITPYGISKHTVEHYLFTFNVLYGIDYVILRYGNVYGPRQSSQGEAGVFAVFFEQMLAGIQPVIYGDGSKVRDYVYVSDVTRANVAALELGTREIFNIASGVPASDYEVFCLARELIGKPNVECRYAPKRPGEIDQICLNVAKAKMVLQWEPKVSLREGVQRTAESFRREFSSAVPAVARSS